MTRLHVTKHAVRRYIDRIEPHMTFREARHDLNRIKTQGVRFSGRPKDQEHMWHPMGIVMVATNEAVVTVLSRRQSQKFIGRKLQNGKKAKLNWRTRLSGLVRRWFGQSTPK